MVPGGRVGNGVLRALLRIGQSALTRAESAGLARRGHHEGEGEPREHQGQGRQARGEGSAGEKRSVG